MTRPIRNLTASPSESTTDTGPELDAPEWWRVELQVAEAVGQLMEFWGFKRQMGRLWTVLFLSPDPLDVAALTERLQMSSSAVSLSLAELATWGAVRKTWVTGERRDFYSVEPRVWRLVRQVVERRELVLIRDASETFAAADRALKELRSTGPSRSAIAFKRRRLAYLRALASVGDRMVRAFVAGKTVDPSELSSAEEQV
ncbi:MAG: ArsR family transcriptional regulator [Sandaracinaceae bacterium]|jgi:DNA-binding transcriptional regulator GbsR (MarR family)|nr:ArsR family transcriptional regulator [Sandaracinaceae bacterium]MBK7776803.1 ArsR family transcriptional regulator [Sandaracinaceae bacterium]MBK8410439.1 ArsR family transcriptional regulator [Sandaracinaceae bacterium]MBK8590453.1 ArsR family transcriptional regulator [Sandaracinaceae bacterium]MBP7682944.1 ArsR family transcriptional regulator [Deltaproteobacteria bacterium]